MKLEQRLHLLLVGTRCIFEEVRINAVEDRHESCLCCRKALSPCVRRPSMHSIRKLFVRKISDAKPRRNLKFQPQHISFFLFLAMQAKHYWFYPIVCTLDGGPRIQAEAMAHSRYLRKSLHIVYRRRNVIDCILKCAASDLKGSYFCTLNIARRYTLCERMSDHVMRYV